MADISKLKGITQEEAQKLRRANVNTVEQLWLRISEEQDAGLAPLATQIDMTQERLMDLLVAEGLRHTTGFGTAWFKRHWLDIVIIVGLLAVGALIWRVAM